MSQDPFDTFLQFEKRKAEMSEGRNYPHRDEIPPALLPHADNYVKLTGQTPDKRNIRDWISEFTYWQSKGLQEKDIEEAWREAEFFVTRPGSLTSVAVAMKAKKRASQYTPVIFRAEEQQEVKAVPPPSDLFEQTRERLREKARMDKVGQNAREPKPISEVMKGMQS